MTVAELIRKLSEFDPTARVVVNCGRSELSCGREAATVEEVAVYHWDSEDTNPTWYMDYYQLDTPDDDEVHGTAVNIRPL